MQEKALRKEVKTNRGIIVQYQLKKVWIITNYPMFQAVMQLPLSGGEEEGTSRRARGMGHRKEQTFENC
jgi:hypothetical protein